MSIGHRIKTLREQRAFTISRLAQESGVSKAYISQLENEPEKKVSAEILFNIAKALGTTIDVLMGNEVPLVEKGNIPPSLKSFATKHGLSDEEVKMLAGISYKGKHPESEKDWAYIYQTIRTALHE